ncbi:MAG: hypothetical protein ACSW72_03455 [Bacteroidales bacterium]
MKKLLTVLAYHMAEGHRVAAAMVCAVMTAATVYPARAAETIQYLNFDNHAMSVKEGSLLFPYVCNKAGDDLRNGSTNAGFLRIAKGKELYAVLNSSVRTADQELTIEFFVKGGADGVTVANWLLSLGGTWGGASAACRVEVTNSKTIRLRIMRAGGSDLTAETSAKLTDGKWHHIGITVEPINDGAASHIVAYVDYSTKVIDDSSAKFKYAGLDCLDFNRSGGSTNGGSGVDVDELKFTRGILSPDDFMRLDLPPPVDGETLLYLPLDGDGKSIAHTEKQGWASTDMQFVGATRTRTRVKEHGTDVKVRDLNLKYLSMGGYGETKNSYWALTGAKCQTCTIEFFIKGNPNVGVWCTELCYGYWKTPGQYGFLVDVNSDKTILFKPGVGDQNTYFTIPADISKEKWHHVAIEIQPSTKEGCEGGSHFEAFLDYNETPVATADYSKPFNGLYGGRICFSPEGNAKCSIDELRITKGILPVSKFLAFRKQGLFLVVR